MGIIMLKLIVIFQFFIISAQISSQSCAEGNTFLFASNFLSLNQKSADLQAFHYTSENNYESANIPQKRTEDYIYLHNGNNLKGAQDVFTGNSQGSAWIRNFDFGKFANIAFEISADTRNHTGSTFEWSGTLAFIKIVKRRSVSKH